MADPLSVTFGVLGLAGLFSTVTEVWKLVDAGRTYSEDFNYLNVRLQNQRARFMQWGREMGFGSESGYDSRLDEPDTRKRIEDTLLHIQHLFANTENLIQVYGIQVEVQELEKVRVGFRMGYERFRTTLKKNQKDVSVAKVTKWSVKDGKKFKTMVERLGELLGDLDELSKECIAGKRPMLAEVRTPDQAEEKRERVTFEGGYAETLISDQGEPVVRATEGLNLNSRYQDTDFDAASTASPSIQTTFYTVNTHNPQQFPIGTMMAEDGPSTETSDENRKEASRECVVCGEVLVQPNKEDRALTSSCKHDLAICTTCIIRSIRTDLEYGTERVRCPECLATMTEDDVRIYADADTMKLYQKRKIRSLIAAKKQEAQTARESILEWDSGTQFDCKNCPGCERIIEKAEGCDHMICTLCGTEFCWDCLVNYTFINKQGNHRHKITCGWYIPLGGER